MFYPGCLVALVVCPRHLAPRLDPMNDGPRISPYRGITCYGPGFFFAPSGVCG